MNIKQSSNSYTKHTEGEGYYYDYTKVRCMLAYRNKIYGSPKHCNLCIDIYMTLPLNNVVKIINIKNGKL